MKKIVKIILLINISCFVFLFPGYSKNSDSNIVTETRKNLIHSADTTHNGRVVPKPKRTNLGLYVTAGEAYEMWRKSPSQVKILDVRTLEEYIFIGHAEMAFNSELFSQSHNWIEDKKHFSLIPNPDFMEIVKRWAETQDIILVMCRSGDRSAKAVNMLTAEGFINVYNIIDGMEGDQISDTESNYVGRRMKNGWKNSRLPWTYDLNKDKVLLSNQ